jgi:DNA-binding MarR family transcriptional regulator
MSIKRTTDVWELSQASGSTLLVLLTLADHADEYGIAEPSITLLAQLARVGERAVSSHLQKLEAAGELLIYRQPGQKNIYIVTTGLTDAQVKLAQQRVSEMLARINRQ